MIYNIYKEKKNIINLYMYRLLKRNFNIKKENNMMIECPTN